MKKILFVMVFAFVATSAMAQRLISYHGEVNIGGSFGVGDNAVSSVNFYTIQGVNITDYASLGVGFGLDLHNDFRSLKDMGLGFPGKETDLLFPLFANVKGYLPLARNMKAFLSVDFGGKFGLTELAKGYNPIFVTPAVGFMFSNFMLQVGYQYETEVGVLGGWPIEINAIQARFGICF